MSLFTANVMAHYIWSVYLSVYTFDSYEGVIVQSQARLCRVITPEDKRIIEKVFLKNQSVTLSLFCSYTSNHTSYPQRLKNWSKILLLWWVQSPQEREESLQSICVTLNRYEYVHSVACVFICTLGSTKTHARIFIDWNIGSTWRIRRRRPWQAAVHVTRHR